MMFGATSNFPIAPAVNADPRKLPPNSGRSAATIRIVETNEKPVPRSHAYAGTPAIHSTRDALRKSIAISRWTTKNKPAAAIHATKIASTLAHAFFASASAPGFAPSSPTNRSWRSVPVARGSRNRQKADRATQPTNPQMIASRRWPDSRPCSRFKTAYAAANSATPGKSKLNASHPKTPAVNGPRGPSRFRATARIQTRFVASRRAEADHSGVAELPNKRDGGLSIAKASFFSRSLPNSMGSSKGFVPLSDLAALLWTAKFAISRLTVSRDFPEVGFPG